jgi:hypothetical protein
MVYRKTVMLRAPTDAKLLHAAIKGLTRKCGARLGQSYLRIAKCAAMMASRHAHAKQFKRDHCQLHLLRSRLGRIIRHMRCKIASKTPSVRTALGLAPVEFARTRTM